MTQHVKIFLASSSELLEDRREFEIFLGRRNNQLIKKGVYLELVIWEHFLDTMSHTRLQDEYNKAIRECDIFVMLFFTKVGKYTAEEFDTAYAAFKSNNKPLIITYFKESSINTGDISDSVLSLLQFKKKLNDMGHFYKTYENTDGLLLHFGNQLEMLADKGIIALQNNNASAGDPAATSNPGPVTPTPAPPTPAAAPPQDLDAVKKNLKRLIMDDLGEAFEETEKILSDDSRHYDMYIGLMARYNRTRKNEAGSLLPLADINMEYARLRQSLQYLIGEIREKDLA